MKKELNVYTDAEVKEVYDYIRDMTNSYYGAINRALEFLPRIHAHYQTFVTDMDFIDNFGLDEDKEACAKRWHAVLKQLAKEYKDAWSKAAFYNRGLKCAIKKARRVVRGDAAVPTFETTIGKLKFQLGNACAFLRKSQTRKTLNAVRDADAIVKRIEAL